MYYVWASMRRRCENPNDTHYKWYGGRGIEVCSRWQDFNNFFADMGTPPVNHVLDRVDVNGNYEPTNCRWVTKKESSRNRRNTKYATLNGVQKTVAAWCDDLGVSHRLVLQRMRVVGMSAEDALTWGDAPLIKRTPSVENEACAVIAETMGRPDIADAIRARVKTTEKGT